MLLGTVDEPLGFPFGFVSISAKIEKNESEQFSTHTAKICGPKMIDSLILMNSREIIGLGSLPL